MSKVSSQLPPAEGGEARLCDAHAGFPHAHEPVVCIWVPVFSCYKGKKRHWHFNKNAQCMFIRVHCSLGGRGDFPGT